MRTSNSDTMAQDNMNDAEGDSSMPLIDPSLLANLSEEQRHEALEAAAIAKRAEERAEQRALERALQRKQQERQREREREKQQHQERNKQSGISPSNSSSQGDNKIVFVSKRKRMQQQKEAPRPSSAAAPPSTQKPPSDVQDMDIVEDFNGGNNGGPRLSEKELSYVREQYMGKNNTSIDATEQHAQKKQRSNKKITFKFRWDNTDDTFNDDDPLYSNMPVVPSSANGDRMKKKRGKRSLRDIDDAATVETVQSKPLDKMTARDWRIFRENYEIAIKGGKAPPPMRSFRESPSRDLPPLHKALLEAIEKELKFKEPSPIQRQAIPIGLQRRDLIGIAETGSGKTVAFGVPLCQYLLNLPKRVLNSVANDGPLALVMAPTRELALQIDGEFSKLLSRQRLITTCAIVGGQPIQQQAQMLRIGVHIVVGTPGRINECIDMAYMVLNQCSYIVLDEADRMIDMGFAPQMESILDAMGGSLKSENEEETYLQEKEDLQTTGVARHRLTAMFSATMPLEVEKIAKKYLRHPAVISIGDQDSGKNARITQKIMFLASPSQKEKALEGLLRDPRFVREKVIVFVNEKKHADGVGRMVERSGRQCVVMHGGKSQEQREENLETFRRGGVVMVATDVAGRGLDVPDVAHVINYDLPTRSIENYTHRIGRTGRAGKVGFATSFITDEDEGIMAALKSYLESTGNQVPERLARHPAATAANMNNLID